MSNSKISVQMLLCCAAFVTVGIWCFSPSADAARHIATRPSVAATPTLSRSTLFRPADITNAPPSDASSLNSETALQSSLQDLDSATPSPAFWAPLGVIAISLASIYYNFAHKKSAELQPLAMLSSSGRKETREDSKDQMRKMVDAMDSNEMMLLSRGGTMQDVASSKCIAEIATMIQADQKSRADLTPKEVVLEMQRGNGRFWMGLSERPEMSAMERRALILAQAPKIAVLSCSDSRVPVEIIFDQGLGEIFVVRMAGNVLDSQAHGSLEFAVAALGVKVLLVIGHEGCGAVKGAITMSPEAVAKEPADLQAVLKGIKAGLDVQELEGITDARSREREAIVLNTSNQVKKLSQNSLFQERVKEGTLLIAGAFYEISSGIVDFFSLDKNGLVIDL